AQVRVDLPRRLRHRPRSLPGAGKLFPLLQSSTSAPGARLSDAGRPVPAQTQKEEVIFLMGDAVPHTPWDLSLSFSRMDAFRFTGNSTCRTIERLDRRIGQRRDATRAPIQARNGWRPPGRRLGQPATPSKDGRNFVQTMGSTSNGAQRIPSGGELGGDAHSVLQVGAGGGDVAMGELSFGLLVLVASAFW